MGYNYDPNTGPQGSQGPTGPPGMWPEAEGEEGAASLVPGPQGLSGPQGTQGVPGQHVWPDQLEDELPAAFTPTPGPQGPQGIQGIQGVAGGGGSVPPGAVSPMDGEEDPWHWPEKPSQHAVAGPEHQFPGGNTFLRADGVWAAPAGAPPAATTVEINVGSSTAWRGKFTITDASITATSKVFCWQAPGPYTGKGTRADEAELAPVRVVECEPAAGSVVVKWRSVESFTPMLASPRPINQFIPVAAARDSQGAPEVLGVKIRGVVSGNIKFSYLVF